MGAHHLVARVGWIDTVARGGEGGSCGEATVCLQRAETGGFSPAGERSFVAESRGQPVLSHSEAQRIAIAVEPNPMQRLRGEKISSRPVSNREVASSK